MYATEVAANKENEVHEEISDQDLYKIYELLKRQQEGIRHLTDILAKDMRDVKIMMEPV